MNLKQAFLLQLCDTYHLSIFLDVVRELFGFTKIFKPRSCDLLFYSFYDGFDNVVAVLP